MRSIPTQYAVDVFLTDNHLRSYGIKAVRGYTKTGPYVKVLLPPSCEYLAAIIPETGLGGTDIFVEIAE